MSQIHQELIDQNCPIHDPSNALVINRTLKDQLLEYRQHLEACLEKVQKQFQKNRDYLAKCKKFTRYSSTSYYHKCAPYFKDPQFNFAPNNADYIYRKVVLKEFFASDLVRVKRWKMSEKIALVNNVRDQIIEHLKSKMLLGESKNMKTRKSLSKQKKIAAGDNFRKMPLLELWRKVQSDETSTFEINWESVTFNAVEDNHNVFECEGIWNASLRPDLSREQWTDEENDQLINAVKFYSNENWDLIAAELSGRSSLMCFLHYALHFVEAPAFNVRWTPDEDSLLAEAIEACTHCGIVNWKRVSLLVPNRSRTQCYNRATDGVGPGLKRGCFSKEENQMILEWVDKNGSDFRTFPESILPARSLKQIRMHYNLALKHDGNINSWTKEEDKILMDFVEKEGQKKWLQIAVSKTCTIY